MASDRHGAQAGAVEGKLRFIRAFTRSLSEDCPFGKLSGTSEWRDVLIPFNAEGAKQPLAKLELNLVLAGAGLATERVRGLGRDVGAIWLAVGGAGVLIIGVPLVLRLVIASQHRKAEQRRMKALDAV